MVICRFFLQGRCTKGDSCPFEHGHTTTQPCSYFQRGYCKFGALCGSLHEDHSSGVQCGNDPAQERVEALQAELSERNATKTRELDSLTAAFNHLSPDPKSILPCKSSTGNACTAGATCACHVPEPANDAALDQYPDYDGGNAVQHTKTCQDCGGYPHEPLICVDVKAGTRERRDVNEVQKCPSCWVNLPFHACSDFVECVNCRAQTCRQCRKFFFDDDNAFYHFEVEEDEEDEENEEDEEDEEICSGVEGMNIS